MNAKIIAGGGPNDFLTVRYLCLEGTNREIGAGLARAARAVHGDRAGPLPAGERAVQRARRRWYAQNYPIFSERMCGVADAFGLDPEREDVELGMLSTYGVPAGCSVVYYPGSGTKDGHGILSRHFDFPTLTYTQLFGCEPLADERPLAADPWIVELHPDDGYASISIAIMDVLGAMDGVNEAGLSVALLADNESPNQEPSRVPQVGLSEQHVVRFLLDTCATVDEAKQALLMAKQYYWFVACHFVIADATGAAFVWEYSPGHNIEYIVEDLPSTAGRTVCTNHLLHRREDDQRLPADSDVDGTAAFTYSRWTSLAHAVESGTVVDRDGIREQFRAVRFEAPVPMARTFWHALYDVDEPGVEVSFFLRDEDDVSRYTEPIRLAIR